MHDVLTDFSQWHRPVWAEINLDHVAHNIREFRRITPPHTQLMAIVKADGYGHGAVEVAKAALEAGAARLAIAFLEEGIVLRRKGLSAPIMILGVSSPGTEKAVIEHELTLPFVLLIRLNVFRRQLLRWKKVRFTSNLIPAWDVLACVRISFKHFSKRCTVCQALNWKVSSVIFQS